ncbi:hypothetical protein H5410_040981 [Solanum commersonii]|uniref:Uncharacterized protein n=1 Tax=Solanum commersonii TaxID=4109 RepID=A0A9J5XQB5_SOLCO|nr:hypothetical protein H5410_040981 [Solanum commersonii]
MMYAKFSTIERLSMWDDLYSLSFNLSDRRFPIYPQKYEDFACCIDSCDLSDIKFIGNPFTL